MLKDSLRIVNIAITPFPNAQFLPEQPWFLLLLLLEHFFVRSNHLLLLLVKCLLINSIMNYIFLVCTNRFLLLFVNRLLLIVIKAMANLTKVNQI